jgi:Uri superfamily endonuclease
MRGTYTILVKCSYRGYATFGSLGRVRLQRGWYLYTGSALGHGALSLEARLGRHERRSKTLKWHVDYLTSRRGCSVTGVVYLVSDRRLECRVNRSISKELNAAPVLHRIGASDCKCDGHLLWPSVRLNDVDLMKQVESVYAKFGLPRSYTVKA